MALQHVMMACWPVLRYLLAAAGTFGYLMFLPPRAISRSGARAVPRSALRRSGHSGGIRDGARRKPFGGRVPESQVAPTRSARPVARAHSSRGGARHPCPVSGGMAGGHIRRSVSSRQRGAQPHLCSDTDATADFLGFAFRVTPYPVTAAGPSADSMVRSPGTPIYERAPVKREAVLRFARRSLGGPIPSSRLFGVVAWGAPDYDIRPGRSSGGVPVTRTKIRLDRNPPAR